MKKKSKLSEKDKKSWEDFLKIPQIFKIKKKSKHKKKKVLRYKFDLHGLSIDEANKKVTEIIENCYEKGFQEILLITGQGTSLKLRKKCLCFKGS